jgi:hypothetical protein
MIRARVNVMIVRLAASSMLCCFSGFVFVAIRPPYKALHHTFSNWGMAKEFGGA